ncbi:alpha/beta fold hydrolase [Kutzneria kofuensis]|uniref:Pimeloyl-ACP methyl ester carboxylesterase n=1 Tax=Kutzneria kofuensis TaxID=103725 RepID=A0A7W9KRI0_9PSEU|nr:alpha/beta hydrolase [Kutzneria kofuensis]MBB5897392.1 pimeloyl-ACP methyl ester carboxylesterase [Kutzneria kofuensis]
MRGERLNDGLTAVVVGEGPPLVTLPGLGKGADLAVKVPPLAGFSATVLARGLNRRVHHIQRPPAMRVGTTLAELAGWHATALRERFDGAVDVMGTSGGGATALQLAIDHPDVVRRLILCTIASRPGEQGKKTLLRLTRGEREGRNDPWAASGLVTRGPRRVLTFVAYAAAAVGGRKRAPGEFALVEAVQNWDVTDRLGEVAAPTLVIAGTRDAIIPFELARATAAGIPDATLLAIEGGDHMTTMFDRRVAPAIREFLDHR